MAGNLEAQKLEEEIRELKTELRVSQKFMKQVLQKLKQCEEELKQCEEELRAKISGKEKELEQLSKQAEISVKEKEHEKKEKGLGKWGKFKIKDLLKLGIGEKEKEIGEDAIPEAVQTEIRNLETEEQDLNEKMDAKQRDIKEKEREIDCMKKEMENGEAENKNIMKNQVELRKKEMELNVMKGEMENMKMNQKNSCLKKQLAISSLQEKEKEEEKSKFRLKELKAKSEREKSRLGLDKDKFNYAVTGGQAAGKSSLINGLLGLGRNSEGAAKTDIVYCTSATSQYSHPSLKDVILWDLPGVGTPDHPEETYYEDTALEAFDAIIIITGDRILDIELKIAKRSQEAGKRVVFVRSKADKSIREICIDQKITMAEAAEEFRKKVEENFKEELKKVKLSGISILIVSSRAFLSDKPPYKYLNDRSLEGMDEELVTKFLSETGTPLG